MYFSAKLDILPSIYKEYLIWNVIYSQKINNLRRVEIYDEQSIFKPCFPDQKKMDTLSLMQNSCSSVFSVPPLANIIF